MTDYQTQHASMYGEPSSSHGGSFDAFTPVSGSASPAGSQRLGTAEYDAAAAAAAAAASFTDIPPLDLTPPPSASVPYFSMNAAAAAAASMNMSGLAASGYMSTSSFPPQPATPERNHSFSSASHMSAGSPHSPGGDHPLMSASYPASISSMSSMTSMSSADGGALCGPATPEAYPFPEMSGKSHSSHMAHQKPLPMSSYQQQQQHHQQQHHQQQHQQHQHQQEHQHQHAAHHRAQQSPSAYMFPTPSSHHLSSDPSPSEFCWNNNNNRPESPAINYFGERPALPPPPPSATLKSSVLGSNNGKPQQSHDASGAEAYYSPMDRYGTPTPIRRHLRYANAQMSAKALQEKMGAAAAAAHSYEMAALGHAVAGGHIITRNGIQVSKVASGAFKCIVPGCPSRPFKRSEHLKRHVTTHHENKDQFPCQFCGRQFNRKDNWRSHLKLHTVARGKNARTDYFPLAVSIYEAEMAKITKCRARKDSDVY